MTPEQELKMRGIKISELMKEHPRSWESVVVQIAHADFARKYWRAVRNESGRPDVIVGDEPETLHEALFDKPVKMVRVRPEPTEYTFTDTQLKIAMRAQERRK